MIIPLQKRVQERFIGFTDGKPTTMVSLLTENRHTSFSFIEVLGNRRIVFRTSDENEFKKFNFWLDPDLDVTGKLPYIKNYLDIITSNKKENMNYLK